MITKNKILETSLLLTLGFLLLYFIFKKPVFIYVSFAFGITGIFIPSLSRYITIAWFKLADVLNFIISKIILGIIYFILLTPISFIYRASGKDSLKLKKGKSPTWVNRDKKYSESDLENTW